MSTSAPPLLPPEDLASQLSTLEVLLSLFSDPSELDEPGSSSASTSGGSEQAQLISPSCAASARHVGAYLELPVATLGDAASTALKAKLPRSLALCLTLDPMRGERQASEKVRKLVLDVALPLRSSLPSEKGVDRTRPQMSLRQPDWMSRAAHAELWSAVELHCSSAQQEEEDGASLVMAVTELVSELAVPHIQAANTDAAAAAVASATQASTSTSAATLSPLVLRTWHLFPSLSTPAKRDDLVNYASIHAHSPRAGEAKQPLTGFVLAGKPGLVVLEASLPPEPDAADIRSATATIDRYWGDIKAVSWGDIPSHHKRVTERAREEAVKRVFSDMKEMTETEELGGSKARKGTFGHRNDLGYLERWLESLGLEGRLKSVLGMQEGKSNE